MKVTTINTHNTRNHLIVGCRLRGSHGTKSAVNAKYWYFSTEKVMAQITVKTYMAI